MITDFKVFGLIHLAILFVGILIGTIFIIISLKNKEKQKAIGIFFAVFIFLIRSVRYIMDIKLGVFSVFDLFSLNVCNINLYLLMFCLIKPNRKVFAFTFLIGIPAALSVALFPGTIHPEPGLSRAILFILYHVLLIMGSIYILFVNKFKLLIKDVYKYLLVALFGMMAVYFINLYTGNNFLYIMHPEDGTVLVPMYDFLGSILYKFAIYILLGLLMFIMYFINKIVLKTKKVVEL